MAAPRQRSGRRTAVPRWAAPAAAGAMLAVLILAALAGAGGALLVVVCLLGAALVAPLAIAGRSQSAVLAAGLLALTGLAAAVGLALGGRAETATAHTRPFPLVIGLPLARAKARFEPSVTFHVQHAPYGRKGTVLRATGYRPDGTYGQGDTITLLVGTVAPRSTAG